MLPGGHPAQSGHENPVPVLPHDTLLGEKSHVAVLMGLRSTGLRPLKSPLPRCRQEINGSGVPVGAPGAVQIKTQGAREQKFWKLRGHACMRRMGHFSETLPHAHVLGLCLGL